MGYTYDPILEAIEKIDKDFNLSRQTLISISRYMASSPYKKDQCEKSIYYLGNLLTRYGWTPEEISAFFNRNTELLRNDPNELDRKLVVLNNAGLADEVLFNHSARLNLTSALNSLEIYALIKSKEVEGKEISYETIFKEEVKLCQLEELKKNYQLTKKKRALYAMAYELHVSEVRKQREQENKETLTLK